VVISHQSGLIHINSVSECVAEAVTSKRHCG
jgi:hypothetical protein